MSVSLHIHQSAYRSSQPTDLSVSPVRRDCINCLSLSTIQWWSEAVKLSIPLWKRAYSNILKISPPKTESFQIKNSDVFIFLLKIYIVGTHLNCLTEAVLTSTHNLYFSRNKKNNVYICKPQFYYMHVKVGVKVDKPHYSVKQDRTTEEG